jgi:excisionase family DNA binding protein
MKTSKPFLTLPEVARMLGVTPARAYQLCHSGVLPHIRRGRRLLVPADAWRRWVNEETDRAMAALDRPKTR